MINWWIQNTDFISTWLNLVFALMYDVYAMKNHDHAEIARPVSVSGPVLVPPCSLQRPFFLFAGRWQAFPSPLWFWLWVIACGSGWNMKDTKYKRQNRRIDNENLTMAGLRFTLVKLWFDAQNEWSDDSQPYCFFITFFETNRFFCPGRYRTVAWYPCPA